MRGCPSGQRGAVEGRVAKCLPGFESQPPHEISPPLPYALNKGAVFPPLDRKMGLRPIIPRIQQRLYE